MRARVVRSPVDYRLDCRIVAADPHVGAHARPQDFLFPLNSSPIVGGKRCAVQQVELRRVVRTWVPNDDRFGGVEVGANTQERAALATAIGNYAAVIES